MISDLPARARRTRQTGHRRGDHGVQQGRRRRGDDLRFEIVHAVHQESFDAFRAFFRATRDLRELLRFARIFGLVCAVVVLVLVANTLLMSVQERRREFGICLTIGYRVPL